MPEPRIPSELKPLAKFVEKYGYTLAVPFDNVRCVGYIGTFDKKGREHKVDDGTCFEKAKSLKPHKPARIVLGDFSRKTRFSIGAFLRVFTSIFGISAGLDNAKSVTLKFPKRFLHSSYLTEMEIEKALPDLSAPCRSEVNNPNNFVITETVETNAIAYAVELKKKMDAEAQAKLKQLMLAEAQEAEIGVKVKWESETEFSLIVSDPETTLTVAYKTMRRDREEAEEGKASAPASRR